MITMGSCPLSAFGLIGYEALIVPALMVVSGIVLTAWKPRLKDTNEAMLTALKYGNRLTASRLALELDISIDRSNGLSKN